MSFDILTSAQSSLTPWLTVLADDPVIRGMQAVMVLIGLLLIFLVFFATRDILLRTHSFVIMILCILLVSALPVVGFLIYLLVRPTQTIKQKELEQMVKKLVESKKAPAAK